MERVVSGLEGVQGSTAAEVGNHRAQERNLRERIVSGLLRWRVAVRAAFAVCAGLVQEESAEPVDTRFRS